MKNHIVAILNTVLHRLAGRPLRWLALASLAGALWLPRAAHGQATLPAGFSETRIRNISSPAAMALVPDGRVLVCSQGGAVRVIKNDTLLATPMITLDVSAHEERGLVGVQVDPDFANNGYVYLYYAALLPAPHNRLSRFTVVGDTANPNTEVILFDLPNLSESGWHNGGCIRFGPDGKLYFSAGENNVPAYAQSLETTLGKILRINSDGSIPIDNPFYAQTTGQNRAIWALGFRNPYNFAFQPGTGRMFINDVGYYSWEEINEGVAGGNYGWPTYEGPSAASGVRTPFYAYPHPVTFPTSSAITGGTFYNPEVVNFPASYVGKYFFADGFQLYIKVLDPATKAVTPFATFKSIYATPPDVDGVSALYPTVGKNGFLYYIARSGLSAQYSSLNIVKYTGGSAPIIGTQPTDQLAFSGGEAAFQVAAFGNAPLGYQWFRKNSGAASFQAISGATAPRLNLTGLSSGDNGAQFQCRITNLVGTALSAIVTLTVTGNRPPVPTIASPVIDTFYRAGDTIVFSGSALDATDGTLPPANLSWKVDFHHLEHTHPVLPDTAGIAGGSFTIPTLIEPSPDTWFRLYLTAVNSAGLSATVSREIFPLKTTNTLATDPPGLVVFLDGRPVATPTNWVGVINVTRSLGAAAQVAGGNSYVFDSWSDNGAAVHDISTPENNTTYTARFRLVPPVDNAAMTSQTIPAQMTVGVTYNVSVRMQNTGNTLWPANSTYALAAQNPADNTIWRATPVTLTSAVAPGDSFTFTFPVKAPLVVGPYNFQWQMKKAGTFFGTPSANTVVNVAAATGPAANNAAFVSQFVPLVMAPGGTYHVLVTMRNTGTSIWSFDTKHKLGSANLQDNTRWGFTRVGISNSTANVVAPGETQTFNFRVKAPTTVGQYNFQWRMVQELVGWYGLPSANLVINVTPTAAAPPTVAMPPASLTVNAGTPASFFVGAIGSSPLTFQWQRRSVGDAGFTAIAGATTATYRLGLAGPADNGAEFRCLLTSPAGSATSAVATLTVLGGGSPTPPAISVPPASLTVTTGQPAAFDVTATGTAPLAYQWERKNPADAGFNPIVGATDATYQLVTTVLGDNGAIFRCVVTNAAGSATSAGALLTVNGPVGNAPTVVVPPATQSVALGSQANFTVSVAGSVPMTYQWERKNPAAAGFTPIAAATSAAYQIAAVTAGDNGAQFRCIVGNTVGSATSAVATLTVTGLGGGTAPTILSFTPANGARNVPVTTAIQVVFSKDMDPATINTSTFTLIRQSTTVVLPATVTYNPLTRTATLTPAVPLKTDWTYLPTVVGGAAGVKDLGGLALAASRTWNFYSTDTLGPRIFNIAVSAIGTTSATISWDTNENSDSQVRYGTTTAYGQTTPLAGALVLRRSLPLVGLTRGTLYNFQILSRDGFGNLSTAANATFTTAP